MDPSLESELFKHDLGHKKEMLVILGVKTFKDMARVEQTYLKENLFFDYSELRKFDALREVCITMTKAQETGTVLDELGDPRSSSPSLSGEYVQPQILPPRSINPLPMTTSRGPMDINMSHSLPVNHLPSGPPSIYGYPSYPNPVCEHSYPPVFAQQHSQPVVRTGSDHPATAHNQNNPQSVSDAEPMLTELYYPNTNSNKIRGLGLIFTNEEFPEQENRAGAVVDEINFGELFREMGLEIQVYPDHTKAEILDIIAITAKRQDLSEHDMFVIGISTHGDQGDLLYGRDEKPYSLHRDIVSPFKPDNCPSLKGKPKIFFIQSCRGNKEGNIPQIRGDCYERASVTLESDFLIAYSAVLGFKSFRSTTGGSWFVTQLKRAFEKYRNDFNLSAIITFTNQLVIQKSIQASGECNYVQTCQLVSTLTKLVDVRPRSS
ncbi:hypothetical protein LOD99_3799 [Oopsacas minuta]|uniref:Uncharacterized protein n=1 Tax=Oopsacas minuta TaxID=111878 RepID=A0AAV7JXQ6_9METZ|nr:hypothetical protein LOD99_3799 [Oopsacas minuta]